ncbi:Ldh family oxidoreductase [Candidatus Bathyarchaeota archaeon]|nr:Ldh family oxidoreductase [Candidatus Bathyarchaeota archaeon]
MAEVSWVSFDLLRPFVRDVFRGIGVPDGDADICRDVLLDADLKGLDTHGVNRLKPVYYDRVKAGLQKPLTRLDVVREGPTTAVVDANNGMGMVAAKKSMDLCITKAKKLGMGMVAVRNSTHFGIAGYYAEMAAKEGLIGICGTNARPSIAPTFGVEPMLGTNPLTFAMPTDEEFPFSLDCATSIIQRGKVELYAREGKKLPPGLVITRDGSTKTDPDEVLSDLLSGEAALLPLGGAGEDTAGYKGYGYATVVEILSAALQSGFFLKGITGVNLGHFFIAVDVSAFTELDEFRHTTGEILRSLRSAEKAPGAERIYTAGEKEYLTSLERRVKGVPVNRGVQLELTEMRGELGLTSYRFPFE